MLKFFMLAIAVLAFLTVAVTLIITALICLAIACIVGVPLYLVSRKWLHRQGIIASASSPMDRAKALYVEGKIDLFEFERRVARLIAVEH